MARVVEADHPEAFVLGDDALGVLTFARLLPCLLGALVDAARAEGGIGVAAEDKVAARSPGALNVLDEHLFEQVHDDGGASALFRLGVDFALVGIPARLDPDSLEIAPQHAGGVHAGVDLARAALALDDHDDVLQVEAFDVAHKARPELRYERPRCRTRASWSLLGVGR
jgi:hypothetical protein